MRYAKCHYVNIFTIKKITYVDKKYHVSAS